MVTPVPRVVLVLLALLVLPEHLVQWVHKALPDLLDLLDKRDQLDLMDRQVSSFRAGKLEASNEGLK